MKQKCPDCKNMVNVPEGYYIYACLVKDHWFEPLTTSLMEDVETEEPRPERRIEINSNPLLQMHYYVKAAKGEVSGFGKVRLKNDNTFVVTDIKIFKQVCTTGHTTLDQQALAQFMLWLSRTGEDPNDWKLWWHSHANMSVFFSGTDEDTIQELSRDTTLLSICTNKDGELLGRIDRRGETTPVSVVCVPKKVKRLWRRCKREVKRKVTEQKRKEVKYGEIVRCDSGQEVG